MFGSTTMPAKWSVSRTFMLTSDTRMRKRGSNRQRLLSDSLDDPLPKTIGRRAGVVRKTEGGPCQLDLGGRSQAASSSDAQVLAGFASLHLRFLDAGWWAREPLTASRSHAPTAFRCAFGYPLVNQSDADDAHVEMVEVRLFHDNEHGTCDVEDALAESGRLA